MNDIDPMSRNNLLCAVASYQVLSLNTSGAVPEEVLCRRIRNIPQLVIKFSAQTLQNRFLQKDQEYSTASYQVLSPNTSEIVPEEADPAEGPGTIYCVLSLVIKSSAQTLQKQFLKKNSAE